jgi:hypothetical protein
MVTATRACTAASKSRAAAPLAHAAPIACLDEILVSKNPIPPNGGAHGIEACSQEFSRAESFRLRPNWKAPLSCQIRRRSRSLPAIFLPPPPLEDGTEAVARSRAWPLRDDGNLNLQLSLVPSHRSSSSQHHVISQARRLTLADRLHAKKLRLMPDPQPVMAVKALPKAIWHTTNHSSRASSALPPLQTWDCHAAPLASHGEDTKEDRSSR